ncbi:E3 ubiquitin-protein ligase RFWD3-like [Adelges cooleyi]|uniref:E3 ubiquitin-protein ligase RFWD3-like n=1 Tax=Adelges cooleyi TaxID=133065 RepID=UPI0021806C5B|nr:E3 ubiquitin-protein ligase RFWD3-like [Adelges cooleyi]
MDFIDYNDYNDDDNDDDYSDYDDMEVDSELINEDELFLDENSGDESEYSADTNDSTTRDSSDQILPVDVVDDNSNSTDSHTSSNASASPMLVQQNEPHDAEPTISNNTSANQERSTTDDISTVVPNNDESITDDDAFSCPICLEGLTNTGGHKPACLKCGHIFGENCLQRWIKTGCNSESRRCPTCNTKASLKDIRVLYTKKLVAVDTAELTALQAKLEKETREKNVLTMEVEKWKIRSESLNNELKMLKDSVEKAVQSGQGPFISEQTSIRQCLKKIVICKEVGGCRVMAFNKTNMLLAVTAQCDNPLFNGTHGIRKINASILELAKGTVYVHKKPIRDMKFHPVDSNLLASASLDKFIKLTDFNSNAVVASVETPEPLWSCSWAGDNTNMLVAGSQMGSLFYVDRRFMKLVESDIKRAPACVSIIPLPPSCSRSFISGGFLRTRMDILSAFEQETDAIAYKETLLPLKGFWSSTSFDESSNLILTSAKPCGANTAMRHIVSRIANYNEPTVIQPVVTFYGGDKATQISRSCLVPSGGSNEDTLVCAYDEKANQVKLFSVNSCRSIHNFHVRDTFLDLCHLDGVVNNGRRTIAALSEKSLSIFSV